MRHATKNQVIENLRCVSIAAVLYQSVDLGLKTEHVEHSFVLVEWITDLRIFFASQYLLKQLCPKHVHFLLKPRVLIDEPRVLGKLHTAYPKLDLASNLLHELRPAQLVVL